MGTLSVRGLDKTLSEQLKKIAYAEEKSVNQCVIDILKQHLGLAKQKKFTQNYDDLDHLFENQCKNQWKTNGVRLDRYAIIH